MLLLNVLWLKILVLAIIETEATEKSKYLVTYLFRNYYISINNYNVGHADTHQWISVCRIKLLLLVRSIKKFLATNGRYYPDLGDP